MSCFAKETSIGGVLKRTGEITNCMTLQPKEKSPGVSGRKTGLFFFLTKTYSTGRFSTKHLTLVLPYVEKTVFEKKRRKKWDSDFEKKKDKAVSGIRWKGAI